MPKKKSRRSKDPLSSLKKQYTLKSRADLIDYDYLHKLNPDELKWLADFTKEEIHASVKSGKGKQGIKKRRQNRFNKTKKEVKKIYDSNNARNACIWTIEKAKGMGQYLEDHKETLLSSNPEQYIIEKMDLEQQGWCDANGIVLQTEEEILKEVEQQEKEDLKIQKLNERKAKQLLKSQQAKKQTSQRSSKKKHPVK